MRVAVIIPARNALQVKRCLSSLLLQTYPHSQFEIVVVKDKLLDIDFAQTDIPIKIVDSHSTHPSVKRNLGVKNTNVQFLAFLDEDTLTPSTWLEIAVQELITTSIDGVCGPEVPLNYSFGYRLGYLVSKIGLLESHTTFNREDVKFYQIPLCNCVMKRKTWERVGGFNEICDYHIDDIEFFYIATKLGYKFRNLPQMVIQHGRNVKFPLAFLKKKFKDRFFSGKNSFIFREIYFAIPSIRVILSSYFFVPIFLYFYKMLFFSLVTYMILLWLANIKIFKEDRPVFLLLPFSIIISQLVVYLAFTLGICNYFLENPKKYIDIVRYKKKRLKSVQPV